MNYFTWKEIGLTSDCSTLEAMASRFEESARLMRRMAKEGFKLQVKEKNQLIQAFNEALDLYHNQEWVKAKKRFAEASELEEKFPYRPTSPSIVYIDRCDHFKLKPPGKDWDGVWTMNTK